jgi:UDP-N-acetylmuramoylalanine--D-glutamate ligase
MMKENYSSIIVGLGKTGLSCARFLASRGESFIVMDDSESPSALDAFKAIFPHIPVYLGPLDPRLLLSAKKLIVSPGVSLKKPAIAQAIQKGVEVVGDIELFARCVQAPVIAITGSNAKSTVTTLVGYLLESIGLKVQVGGNLGIPSLDLLMAPTPDYFVLELSSFQLEETISLAPYVATILNVSEDHMDRYQSFEDYKQAKHRIYHQSRYQLVNRQDINTYPVESSHLISFGIDTPKQNEFGLLQENEEVFLSFGKEKLISTRELRINGQHNWLNALAALAICHVLGIPLSKVLPALKQFEGLAHRCEFVAEKNGVRWYNDSKATNVGAAIAALTGLGSTISGKLIWIAGGLGKNADFNLLSDSVKRYVRQGILMGEDAGLMQKSLQSEAQIVQVNSLESAVALASQVAAAGDVVLLSPACASFDMFKNFEHRGEVFKSLVYKTCSESKE